MAAPDTLTLDSNTTQFALTFSAGSADQISITIQETGERITPGTYTFDGLGDGSLAATLNWTGATSYAGKNAIVDLKPSATMLHDFTTADLVTPQALQNEFNKLYTLALEVDSAVGLGLAVGSGAMVDVPIVAMTEGSGAGDVKVVLGCAFKVASGTLNPEELSVTVYRDGTDYGLSVINHSTNSGTIDWDVFYAVYPA